LVLLLQALLRVEANHEYVLYVDQQSLGGSALLPLIAPEEHRVRVHLLPSRNPILWEQVLLPLAARRDQVDLLHATSNVGAVAGRLSGSRPLVLTLFDVIDLLRPRLHHPGLYPSTVRGRLGQAYRREVLPRAARRADRVITCSEASKNDIVSHLGVEPDRVVVVPLAPDPLFGGSAGSVGRGALQQLGLSGPFIMALAALDPRKNLGVLLEAFRELRARGCRDYRLVLVGVEDPGRLPLACHPAWPEVSSHVHVLPFVEDRELASLYAAARVFVYPSLYEGFGLPVLEGMAAGAPVICACSSSIPEVAGNAALLFDPRNPRELADRLCQVLTSEQDRQALIDRGRRRVQEFTWDRTARAILRVYHSVLEDRVS